MHVRVPAPNPRGLAVCACAALLALIALAARTQGAAGAPRLDVLPYPGTPDASPQTQISVLGVAPAQIASVQATGAQSGAHTGRLAPFSGGRPLQFHHTPPARSRSSGATSAMAFRSVCGTRCWPSQEKASTARRS